MSQLNLRELVPVMRLQWSNSQGGGRGTGVERQNGKHKTKESRKNAVNKERKDIFFLLLLALGHGDGSAHFRGKDQVQLNACQRLEKGVTSSDS